MVLVANKASPADDLSGVILPAMTVGVMGAAGGQMSEEVRRRVQELGAAIGRRGFVLVTGACPGLPQLAVEGARGEGGTVIGISPAHNLEEHVLKYNSPTLGYDAIIYTGSGLMGREVDNVLSSDVIAFAGGRSGTLGEFAIAYEEGKAIGVLRGTGGIADHLEGIERMLDKQTGAVVRSGSCPERLLDRLEGVFKERTLPRYLKALRGRDPRGVPDD